MEAAKEILYDRIAAADRVLVGIGEEFSADTKEIEYTPEYTEFIRKLDKEEEWLLPFVRSVYLQEQPDVRCTAAYQTLEGMLDGKDYFIVSLATDDAAYHTKLKKERLVTPCGGYRYMQCAAACEEKVTETDRLLLKEIADRIHEKKDAEGLKRPRCATCGSALVFNRIDAKKYVEEGYIPQWNKYRTWLQGTVNRHLCVLELGVGMSYPAVVRWPFEKVVYYNRKASFFRVHTRLFQLPEETGDRGYAVKAHPVDFLIGLSGTQ